MTGNIRGVTSMRSSTDLKKRHAIVYSDNLNSVNIDTQSFKSKTVKLQAHRYEEASVETGSQVQPVREHS